MSAHRAFHNAVAAANATVRQIRTAPAYAYAWAYDDDRNVFVIRNADEPVAELAIHPGHVTERAALLDAMVWHLNHPPSS